MADTDVPEAEPAGGGREVADLDEKVLAEAVARQLITPTQGRQALVDARSGGVSLIEVLVERGLVSAEAAKDLDDETREDFIPGYRVVSKLGEGGMGVVYRALQKRLDREVALKVVMPHLATDDSYLKRFEREAKAVARLNHPNIVQAYDYGESGGRVWLAMELVQGESLADALTGGALAEDRALATVREVAAGLAHAAAAGIIHRDIKPGNILLCARRPGDTGAGTAVGAKVTDLGLAQMAGTGKSDITATGAILGTPGYMAPEQAFGRDLDHRTDIYSLGATLYQTVTGQRPFEAATPVGVLARQHTERLFDPRDIRTGLSAGLVHLLHGMLAREPEHRYPTYRDLLSDIDRVIEGGMPALPLPPEKSRSIDPPESDQAAIPGPAVDGAGAGSGTLVIEPPASAAASAATPPPATLDQVRPPEPMSSGAPVTAITPPPPVPPTEPSLAEFRSAPTEPSLVPPPRAAAKSSGGGNRLLIAAAVVAVVLAGVLAWKNIDRAGDPGGDVADTDTDTDIDPHTRTDTDIDPDTGTGTDDGERPGGTAGGGGTTVPDGAGDGGGDEADPAGPLEPEPEAGASEAERDAYLARQLDQLAERRARLEQLPEPKRRVVLQQMRGRLQSLGRRASERLEELIEAERTQEARVLLARIREAGGDFIESRRLDEIEQRIDAVTASGSELQSAVDAIEAAHASGDPRRVMELAAAFNERFGALAAARIQQWVRPASRRAPEVRVEVRPDGATVRWDDEPAEPAPAIGHRLIGTHRLVVEKEGFRTHDREVEVRAPLLGAQVVRVALVPLPPDPEPPVVLLPTGTPEPLFNPLEGLKGWQNGGGEWALSDPDGMAMFRRTPGAEPAATLRGRSRDQGHAARALPRAVRDAAGWRVEAVALGADGPSGDPTPVELRAVRDGVAVVVGVDVHGAYTGTRRMTGGAALERLHERRAVTAGERHTLVIEVHGGIVRGFVDGERVGNVPLPGSGAAGFGVGLEAGLAFFSDLSVQALKRP